MTRFLDTTACSPIKSNWSKPNWLQPACLVLVTWTAVTAPGDHAAAARKERVPAISAASRPAGKPIMAIVSLRSQGITVYDTSGWIMRAPVSSGQSGRETPAGVFSVLEKDADHHSNLYDDAWMPHMHRLTWSGIALHGGPLPGYAASHGCVRLPYGFASHLFDVTKVGMRVIVAPGEVVPVEIAHPVLFPSKPGSADAAATRAAEAAAAARKADQAKRAAEIASWAAAQAAGPVHAAENLKHQAEKQLAAADREDAKAQAAEAKAAEAVESAKAKAAEARQTVESAKAKAADAMKTADEVKARAAQGKRTAGEAKARAAEARRTFEEAKARAAEARRTADDANAKAAAAKRTAAEARQTSEKAKAKAIEARQTAEEAKAKAAEARQTADDANVPAAETRQTIEDANAKAAEARQTADDANAMAAEARQTAEEVKAKAAVAKQTAEEVKARAAEANLKTEEANVKMAEAKLKAEEVNVKMAEAKLKAGEANVKAAAAKLIAGEAGSRAADDAKARAVAARHKADDARARASEGVADDDAKLAGAKADQQAKVDAAEAARKAGAEAETRRTETAGAASKAARALEPASVFISRKTQRLYVRQALEPVLEVPVTIQDPDRPIGTHVFTATGSIDGTADLRWTVVSLKGGGDARVAAARGITGGVPDVEPAPADTSGAKAALDRIAIPADVADRVAGMISPRSSVILSDEALSRETGKGTEFVVVMNDEPQGGIKHRNLPTHTTTHHER
jgi:L,D-transpeptidase catalytic domain